MPQEGLTGYRKYRSPAVSQINARKQSLPAIYNLKRDKAYRDKSYDLEKEGLEQSRGFAEENLSLAERAAHDARKRNNLAANMGYAGLGLQLGLGGLNNWDTLSGAFSGGESSGALDFVPGLSGIASDSFAPAIKEVGMSGLEDLFSGPGIFDGLLDESIGFDWSDAFF